MNPRLIFVTGTDTSVGKTLLTALLLCHLRARGAGVLALKPFCSGGRDDAELLWQLQEGRLTLDEINPFYFPESVAPLVSARKHRRRVPLEHVLQHIHSIASRLCSPEITPPLKSSPKISKTSSKSKIQNYLLIEGSGGLLVPLGEAYTVRDLIACLACDVLVVARNQLGTINHTLLTIQSLLAPTAFFPFRTPDSFSLQPSALSLSSKVLLMAPSAPDPSCRSNPAILAELLAPIPVLQLPFLGRNCTSTSALKKAAKKFHKTLARLV